MRYAVLGFCLMVSTPLSALTPDPVCGVDERTGAVWPLSDARATLIVDPVAWPGDVISFDWLGPEGRSLGVVQHCPTDATLIYMIDADAHEPLLGRLHEMLGSDVVHGLDDLRREVRQSAGRARVQSTGPGRCFCDQWRQ